MYGLKFAFEIDSDTPGTTQAQKILINKIEIDPPIDDSQFAEPAAPAEKPFANAPPAGTQAPAGKPPGLAQLLRLGEPAEADAQLQRVDAGIGRSQSGAGDVHEAKFGRPVEFASQKMQADAAA